MSMHNAADFLQDLAVRHLRETMTADLLRRSHAEHAHPAQPVDHAARNVRLSIYFCRIQIFVEKLPKLAQNAIQLRLLRRRNARIWHDPIGNEMSLEKPLGETERLRPGKKSSSAC